MEEVMVVSSASLITEAHARGLTEQAIQINQFTSQVKDLLLDGIDYGQIPKVNKPCLFKAGGEKIQFLLGLTPQYTLLERCYEPIKRDEKGDIVDDSYYRYEFMCSLYKGQVKVAEGVGTANTREKKFKSQAVYNIFPDDLANTVMKIAKKRAFMDAILAVACISDMFTQDLEDSEEVTKVKVDKKTGVGKLTTDDIKNLSMLAWKNGVSSDDLLAIIQKVNPEYQKSTDIKKKDYPVIVEAVKQRGSK